MGLPIAKIIWHKTDSSGAHNNHLHVEGDPRFIGWNNGIGKQPPATNPGLTPALWAVFVALHQEFGQSRYFLDTAPAEWTHMGWYNRRTIGGKRQWSQHAWANAIDIGPYWYDDQQVFYDFLTGKEDDMALSPEVEKFVNDMYRSAVMERNSNGGFAGYAVDHIRAARGGGDEIDQKARAEAARAHERLDSAKEAL